MGSTMKPTIFHERVATALKSWHNTAKKHVKESKHSNNTTPFSSRPSTPTHGMSPVHLLHRHTVSSSDSLQTSNYENQQWDNVEGSNSPTINHTEAHEIRIPTELPVSNRHEISISSKDFSFEKRYIVSD